MSRSQLFSGALTCSYITKIWIRNYTTIFVKGFLNHRKSICINKYLYTTSVVGHMSKSVEYLGVRNKSRQFSVL